MPLPQVVMTIGETLTAEDREFIEETFQAKVVDDYACSEVGNIAWQCLEGTGYHINADNVIVEILDKDGLPATEGQVGEVVLTSLHRRAMPIIRYKNGDLASFTSAECPCGCKLPMIAKLHGRTGEDFTLPDGTKVPWHQLKGLMNHPQVRQFQLVQDARGDLVINYVLVADTPPDSVEKLLEYRFGRLLGDSIGISARQVPQIAPSASGKMKLVVSHFGS